MNRGTRRTITYHLTMQNWRFSIESQHNLKHFKTLCPLCVGFSSSSPIKKEWEHKSLNTPQRANNATYPRWNEDMTSSDIYLKKNNISWSLVRSVQEMKLCVDFLIEFSPVFYFDTRITALESGERGEWERRLLMRIPLKNPDGLTHFTEKILKLKDRKKNHSPKSSPLTV